MDDGIQQWWEWTTARRWLENLWIFFGIARQILRDMILCHASLMVISEMMEMP
jgi:hypothetical protein